MSARIPLNALIVEDCEEDALLLVAALKSCGYETTWQRVDHEAALRKALAQPQWEIIFCDYHLPALDAPCALQVLRGTGRELPFIVVSGTIGEDIAVEALKLGADDYLLKGHMSRLGSAVERALSKARSERKIVEQAALLDQAQDAILVQGLEGTVAFWNRSAARVFGWTAEEIVGQRVQDLLWEQPEDFQAAMEAVLNWGEWDGEVATLTKEGVTVLMQARWSLLRDERGLPQSVLAINTDITERKKLEAQFFRAQRMESIGTLASGIAHDLNNVLGPIILAVDLFKMTMRDARDLDLLETVELSAKRGAALVRQVLSFGRGMDGSRIPIPPGPLLHEIGKIVQDTFPKSIAVKVTVAPGVWQVIGDPTQLHQVLLNLCVNARDAMPRGGRLTLQVTNQHLDEPYAAMHPEARAGDYLLFDVRDTGTGMAPEVSAKMFDPFFTTKEIGQGTGLGLPTTLAIVKSHGGFLTVESAPGEGTCFQIYLPADTTANEEEAGGECLEFPLGQGELILVIDDELSVRTIMKQTLEAFGYRVTLAAEGAEAVSEYAQHGPEIAVVVTDMMMPVMDGAATIRALMRLNPEVKIIAASGLSAKASEAESAGAGVQSFLPKPYTAATLLQALRRILD